VTITLRSATAGDGPVLQEIELQAGERFREVGMDAVADHEPAPLDTLAAYAAAGRSWVAVDDDGPGGPIGYVIVDVVDGNAHVEQVSVVPAAQGRGVGRALLDQVRAWAVSTGRLAITLTTFADVPWNGPLYAHLGFQVLSEAEIGPELAAVRAAETAHGLDPAGRVCMRLDLDPMAELAALVRGVIDANLYMVLGTADEDGVPWTSPVFYAARGYHELYWISSPEVDHSRNLVQRPQVSIVVFDSRVVPGEGRPVYMAGVAEEVTRPEDIAEGLRFYPGSPERGGRPLAPEDVQPPATYRLYRAIVTRHWTLCPREAGPCGIHGRGFDHRVEVSPEP
jgi:GNAT superfamily N-acetyltransferase